jgi:hypothetical protein
MDDNFDKALRDAAVAAVNGVDVIASAVKYLHRFTEAVDTGEIVWMDKSTPKGSRGLEGKSKEFSAMVIQANTPGGIDHSGVFVLNQPAEVTVIVMPKAMAVWVYRKATASRN